jgi:hypothetical protein
VKNQVDASFFKWFGQLDNSIDQKVTAAVAKEIKVSEERGEIGMGKMFTAIDRRKSVLSTWQRLYFEWGSSRLELRATIIRWT